MSHGTRNNNGNPLHGLIYIYIHTYIYLYMNSIFGSNDGFALLPHFAHSLMAAKSNARLMPVGETATSNQGLTEPDGSEDYAQPQSAQKGRRRRQRQRIRYGHVDHRDQAHAADAMPVSDQQPGWFNMAASDPPTVINHFQYHGQIINHHSYHTVIP